MNKNKKKLKYVLDNIENIKYWKSQGASDSAICRELKISRGSWYAYLKESKELQEAISNGKQELVNDLTNELIRKAKPHILTTVKTTEKNGEITVETIEKSVDGDLGALIFALKNYDKENWSNEPNQLDIKKKELELKEKALENNMW